MAPHPFVPEEPGSPGCRDCMMGRGHRNHIAVATTPTVVEPVSAPTTATVARSIDAAFHETYDSAGPRGRVFRELVTAGYSGLTDEECMNRPALADMPQNTVRPRRVELEQSGLVTRLTTPDGACVKRKTTSGRSAQVWVLSTAARRLLHVEAELRMMREPA